MPYSTLSSPNANFSPVEFYDFANQLYQHHESEVAYRTIIGRAYYAAFLSAKESAKIVNTSGSVHNEVIVYFSVRDKVISNNLKDLFNLRKKADYQPRDAVQKREAGESLRLAKNILIKLNYLL